MTNSHTSQATNTTAGFRRIECVCGKRIRVADQINVLSLKCPRCGKTLLMSSAEPARGLPRGVLIALLTAVVALGGGAVLTVKGCIEIRRKTVAEENATATHAEATEWLKESTKADANTGAQIEKKLTQVVLDVYVADKGRLLQSLESIRKQLFKISTATETRKLLLTAKSILKRGNLEPATLMEMRKSLDAYLQADADSRDPGDAQEAHRMLGQIEAATDSSRVRAVLDALDDAAFFNAAQAPPKDGLPSLPAALRNYQQKWVFPKVYSDAAADRDKRRRDEEQARSVKAEEERRLKFAVRRDFIGEILGEDPFVYQRGEWTYMLTGGKRISVMRSTDLLIWEDRGELLKGSKLTADFPVSLSKPECFAEDGAIAVRCEATQAGRPTEQYVFTAYVKSLDPQEFAPDDNVLRVRKDGGGRLDRSVTLNGKKWQFGVGTTEYRGGADHYSFKNRTKHGHSLTCVHVTCDGKPRSNLYKAREDSRVKDLGTLVLGEYLKYSDLGGLHPFVDSKGQPFLAHHFSDTDRGGRRTICIRPIVFAADGWPLAGEPLSSSCKWQNDGAALKVGSWTHICTHNVVPHSWYFGLRETGGLSTQGFRADGTIGGRESGITWKQNGDFLTLEWPKPASDKRMPDANYVDECVLGGQGTWYVGRNQLGELIRGIYRDRLILR